MDRLHHINTLLNIIYDNERAVMRDLKNFEYLGSFSEWLEYRGLDNTGLKSITEDDVRLIQGLNTYKDVDSIIHTSFNDLFNSFKEKLYNDIHIVFIHGYSKTDINISFTEYKGVHFYEIPVRNKDELTFYDLALPFFKAVLNADVWPGILIISGESSIFKSMSAKEEFDELLHNIDESFNLFNKYHFDSNNSYFIHLSDLHLGKDSSEEGRIELEETLDYLSSNLLSAYPIKFLLTGDMMDSPNRKNMYLANDFMNMLKKKYKGDVTFVLGNHDVIVHGFNIGRVQKSKVIAYLLGENIKVLKDERIVFIKLDSNSEGNLARGKVGERQLQEIDDELSAIEHLEEYTIFVLVHHHVYEIEKADFVKLKWFEKLFIGRIVDQSKALIDAKEVIEWTKKHNVQYIFHGHKHVPYFRMQDDQFLIGAGSATGGLKEEKSQYLSFNLLKYSTSEQCMKTCLMLYVDKKKDNRFRIELRLFEEI